MDLPGEFGSRPVLTPLFPDDFTLGLIQNDRTSGGERHLTLMHIFAVLDDDTCHGSRRRCESCTLAQIDTLSDISDTKEDQKAMRAAMEKR